LRIVHQDGSEQAVDCNSFYTLRRGDVFEIYSAGGGGFGDPRKRPVEQVLTDVRDGLVSAVIARDVYGVVIDPLTLVVDEAATTKLRTTA
jgi:N-methylhydantoinase B